MIDLLVCGRGLPALALTLPRVNEGRMEKFETLNILI